MEKTICEGGEFLMDFLDSFVDRVNAIENLPTVLKKGYLGVGESFVIYGIPGSEITEVYMDGSYEESLNFEIAMQSQNPEMLYDVLWSVQTEIEQFMDVPSKSNMYEFEEIRITNKPFINQVNEQGWFVFLLDFTAVITIQNTRSENING